METGDKSISRVYSIEELQGRLQELEIIRDRDQIKAKGGLTISIWCADIVEWCGAFKHVIGGRRGNVPAWDVGGQKLLELTDRDLLAKYKITVAHSRAALLGAKSCAGTTVPAGIDLIVPTLQHPDIEPALKEALLDAMGPHISEGKMAQYRGLVAAGGPEMDEERV